MGYIVGIENRMIMFGKECADGRGDLGNSSPSISSHSNEHLLKMAEPSKT